MLLLTGIISVLGGTMKKTKEERMKHAARSRNYKTRLKQAVNSGDFEDVVKSIMLLAIKHNDETDWKASPRTWMELLQVLHKFRVEFGTTDGDFDDILKVLRWKNFVLLLTGIISVLGGTMKKTKEERMKHAARSRNYKTRLKQAVNSGDFEDVVKSIMLLAIKHNDETDWKASPRTWMELLQVLHKFRVEFGTTDGDFDDILKVLDGGKSE